jgi:glycosyltransferase involved in cell wall biosynthesis
MTVAVIMAIYNAEKTLLNCLKSLHSQTYKDWYLIPVFNNCTDNSEEIFHNWYQETRESDPDLPYKITKVSCSEQGHVPARNAGFLQAFTQPTIDYIGILDSDDYWWPEKLEKQVKYLEEHPEVDILGSQIRIIPRDYFKPWIESSYPLDDDGIKASMKKAVNPMANSATIFKREVILRVGLYDDLFSLSEDFWFWLKASKWFTFANLPEMLCDYTSWANPKYTPVSPHLAAHCMNLIKEHFPKGK